MLWGWKLQYFISVSYRKKIKLQNPINSVKMMIHQHLAFPGQLNQAGFHTTFHQRLSVARRELTWGLFFTGAGGSNSARFTIHTKTTMGH